MANVYLDALDRFVKHELKCRHYLRYCDDFVLLAQTSEQLLAWKQRIAQFLAERLALQLNDARERLRLVSDGVDFLGYIVRPFHLLVRRRVIGHLREALARSERELVHRHAVATEYRFDAEALNALQASLASYLGHLRRAACRRLVMAIWAAHPWLANFIELDLNTLRLRRRDRPPAQARTVLQQYRHWFEAFRDDVVLMQIGAFVERLQWPPRRLVTNRAGCSASGLRRMRPTRRGAIEGFPLPQLPRRVAAILASGRSVTLVGQLDAPAGRIVQRVPVVRWVCGATASTHN